VTKFMSGPVVTLPGPITPRFPIGALGSLKPLGRAALATAQVVELWVWLVDRNWGRLEPRLEKAIRLPETRQKFAVSDGHSQPAIKKLHFAFVKVEWLDSQLWLATGWGDRADPVSQVEREKFLAWATPKQ